VVVDGGRLVGQVRRVLGADRAEILVVAASVDGEQRLFVVDRNAPGVTITPRRLLDRSRTVADVELAGVLGEPLDADVGAQIARIASVAAVLVAADAVGAMARMLDLAVDYSAQRQQFGVPIGSFQAVKHAAATILVDLEAGRSAVYYAAASVAEGSPESPLHAAAVKAQVTGAAAVAADTALTMHGAIGYTWEHDLHLFYKRARLDEHLFGEARAWNDLIADALALTPEGDHL
jgi:alkylation response protein AidB-like acyl-CoA dehydrogenase